MEKLALKKSLVALAALAVAGIASAQSSVTLFGVVDATISGFSNKSEDRNTPTLASLANQTFVNRGTATTSQTVLRNSGYNSSRLGFRGTEDAQVAATFSSFWLEGALNNDDGTGAAGGGGQNWQRRSTVSLSGNFGEVPTRSRLHPDLLERHGLRPVRHQWRRHQHHLHRQRLQQPGQRDLAKVASPAPTRPTPAPATRSATSCRRTSAASTVGACTP